MSFQGADTEILATRVTGACAKAASRAGTIAANLRAIADTRCSVFGPKGDALATTLRSLADGLTDGTNRLATFQAMAQQNAGAQDQAGAATDHTPYWGEQLGDSIWDEVIGFFQFLGGLDEVVAGAAVAIGGAESIYPIFIGGAIALHGIDNMNAGWETMTNPDDEVKKTWTEKNLGYEVDFALSLAGGLAGAVKLAGVAARGAREGGEALAKRGGREIAKAEAKKVSIERAIAFGEFPLVDDELRKVLGDGPDFSGEGDGSGGGGGGGGDGSGGDGSGGDGGGSDGGGGGGKPPFNPAKDTGALGPTFRSGVYEGGNQYGTFREDRPIADWLADERGASVHSRVQEKGIQGVKNPDAMVRFDDADPGSISEFKTAMKGVAEQDDALRTVNINTWSGNVIDAGVQLEPYKGELLVYDGRTAGLTREQADAIAADAVRRVGLDGGRDYGKALPPRIIFILGDNSGYEVRR